MKKQSEKSSLVLNQKIALKSGLLSERKVWRLWATDRYPSGLKYRLVLADPKQHEVILLYDNHWPKGPHIHWTHQGVSQQRPYEFKSLEILLSDFIQESEVEEKRYHEDKKNSD